MESKICKYCEQSFISKQRGQKGNFQQYCSRSCFMKTGIIHEAARKKTLKIRKFICRTCKKIIIKASGEVRNPGRTVKFCSQDCYFLYRRGLPVLTEEYKKELSLRWQGENNPRWNNGATYIEYSPDFSSALKSKIHVRDNHHCQLCLLCKYRVAVHHIDCDKKNSSENNLILLCIHCHTFIHFYRKDDWEEVLKEWQFNRLFSQKASLLEILLAHGLNETGINAIHRERQANLSEFVSVPLPIS